MIIRAFVYLSCLFVLAGCYNESPMPRIDYSFNAPTIAPPKVSTGSKSKQAFAGNSANLWMRMFNPATQRNIQR